MVILTYVNIVNIRIVLEDIIFLSTWASCFCNTCLHYKEYVFFSFHVINNTYWCFCQYSYRSICFPLQCINMQLIQDLNNYKGHSLGTMCHIDSAHTLLMHSMIILHSKIYQDFSFGISIIISLVSFSCKWTHPLRWIILLKSINAK